MKLQLPHHQGSFGITPCAGSAISAFFTSTASPFRWSGHHSNAQQDFANLADVCAPGQDMSNPDSWTASILIALKCTYALLLADYEYTEWRPPAGPASSDASVAIAGPGCTQNPNVDGTGHSNPSSALPSLVLPPLSKLFVSSQGEGQHHSNLETQQQAGDRPPTDPSQRIITTRTSCNVGKIINMCLVMSRSHGVKSI